MRRGGSNPNTGHRTTPPIRHSTRGTERTTRGTPTPNKGGTNTRTGGSTPQYPPFNAMPPHHCNATPHHDEGGGARRIPHHTKEYGQTYATAHHTPGNEQQHDTTQYSLTCTESRRHRPHTPGWVDQHNTHHRHSTHHTPEDGHHPAPSHLTLFTFTQPTNNNDQR